MRILSNLLLRTCLFGMCLSCAAQAFGQFGGDRIQRPINTPAFSPYLNLFRSGDNSGPVMNYYGLVKPQLNAMEQNQQLGQNLQMLQMQQMRQQTTGGFAAAPGVPGYSQLGITGHPVVFQSFSSGGAGGMAGEGFGGGGFGGGGGFAGGGVGGGGFGGVGLTGVGQPSMYSGGTSAGFAGPGMGGMGGFGMGGISGHPAAFGTFNQSGR